MQDLLMIGDEMDIETRRNLCSRAANLEQEYLEYFYYEAAPTQPHSFASRIPKVKVEAKAGEVDLNGNQRGHEGQAATVTFENRNGSMWLGAAETVEGAASTIINFSDPRPSHSGIFVNQPRHIKIKSSSVHFHFCNFLSNWFQCQRERRRRSSSTHHQ